ncbi:rod shape-determining protein MreC [Poriferisphaera sp. WC338]|uniref:rod shape-determining protein MreC n=1 Tax=Poriferisphaera sp. WC338 TaxID=3425129 RepID=UPI003D814E0B
MVQRSGNTAKMMGVVVVLLVISSLLPARWGGMLAMLPKGFLQTTLSPVSGTMLGWSVSMSGGEGNAGRVVPELEKYEDLQAYYADAKKFIAQLLFENERLREEVVQLRGVQETRGDLGGLTFLDARVTMNTGDKLNPILTVDRGSNKGVHPGQVVTRGRDLVGVVMDVGVLTSRVQLVTSESAPPLGVKFMAPRELEKRFGREEFLELAEDRKHFYVDVEVEYPVYQGDWVHLSDEQGSWPEEAKAFIVGEVEVVEDHPKTPFLMKRVVVKPRVNLDRLTRVDVIIPVE